MPVVMVLARWSDVKQLLHGLPKKFRDTQSEQNRRRVISLLEGDNCLTRHTDRTGELFLGEPPCSPSLLDAIRDDFLFSHKNVKLTIHLYCNFAPLKCQADYTLLIC